MFWTFGVSFQWAWPVSNGRRVWWITKVIPLIPCSERTQDNGLHLAWSQKKNKFTPNVFRDACAYFTFVARIAMLGFLQSVTIEQLLSVLNHLLWKLSLESSAGRAQEHCIVNTKMRPSWPRTFLSFFLRLFNTETVKYFIVRNEVLDCMVCFWTWYKLYFCRRKRCFVTLFYFIVRNEVFDCMVCFWTWYELYFCRHKRCFVKWEFASLSKYPVIVDSQSV